MVSTVYFTNVFQQSLSYDWYPLPEASSGVPWLVRKMISGKMRKGQFLMNRNPDGTYTYTTGDPSRNLQYRFNVGETFTATGYDGKQHKITISVEGDKVKEAHLNLERDIGEDVFYYFFRDGILISECEASNNGKKATWTREFVKKT